MVRQHPFDLRENVHYPVPDHGDEKWLVQFENSTTPRLRRGLYERKEKSFPDLQSSAQMLYPSAQKIHQGVTLLSGVLVLISALWSLFDHSYYFGNRWAARASFSHIALMLYLIAISTSMIVVSATHYKQPTEWLGMMRSYMGSGFLMIFLGFFILALASDFGFGTGILIIIFGCCSIGYAISHPKQTLQDYPSLLTNQAPSAATQA